MTSDVIDHRRPVAYRALHVVDPNAILAGRQRWNGARYSGTPGHYESWFQRANHPTRPLGLWIRYTIFAPTDPTRPACGELWAIWFDGERGRITAAKSEHPIAACRFDRDALGVGIGDAVLDHTALRGEAVGGGHRIAWSLDYGGDSPPLLLLPEAVYGRGFPRAKALVGVPLCRYHGELDVDGERIAIDGWLGSQNHNWGSRHTDRYAWGQVAGFDGRDDAMLECSTAKLRIGPLWTPWLTVAVLRLGDETFAFNSLARSPLGRAHLDGLHWRFDTGNGRERMRVEFGAPSDAFVGLRYGNPPGGTKICINSKIARCTAELVRSDGTSTVLRSAHRAAFELLRDDAMGITVVA